MARSVGRSVTTIDKPGRWPAFAVVDGNCQRSVLHARHALLKLAVHASAPVRFDVDIVLPA